MLTLYFFGDGVDKDYVLKGNPDTSKENVME